MQIPQNNKELLILVIKATIVILVASFLVPILMDARVFFHKYYYHK